MFNSQHINTDPRPWKCREHEPPCIDAQMSIACPNYAPSHEYDNRPNPVLVAFRDYAALETFGTVSEAVIDRWAGAFASYDEFGGYDIWEHPKNVFHAFTIASPEQIKHARKVFARLEALT